MSLILKGIDMPKNGDRHHITIYDNGEAYITTSNRLYETDRKDVEVVEILTPHGRLIDGDALINKLCEDCFGECTRECYEVHLIKAQLTIDAEPVRRGEWEEVEVMPEAYDIAGVKTWASRLRCSNCGFTTVAIEGGLAQYNYCPYCGAKME